jgi:hypothetical protein
MTNSDETIYQACSGNSAGNPCIGDLVREGLATKKYVLDPAGDVEDIEWTNVSDVTFKVEVSNRVVDWMPGTVFHG